MFWWIGLFPIWKDWREYERLRKEERIERAIIVGFHYEDVEKRREEFHPQGSRSEKTIQSVVKELLPFIDQTFPTYKVGNSRLLIGDSLAEVLPFLLHWLILQYLVK